MELYLQVTDGKIFYLENLFYIIEQNPEKYLEYITKETTLFDRVLSNEDIYLEYLNYYLDLHKLRHPYVFYTLLGDHSDSSKIDSLLNIKNICFENYQNFILMQSIAIEGSESKIIDDNFFKLISIRTGNLYILLYLFKYHKNTLIIPEDLVQLLEYINDDNRSISKITFIKLGYKYILTNINLIGDAFYANNFSNQETTEDIKRQEKIILSFVTLEDFTNQEITDNLQQMLFFFTEEEISNKLGYVVNSSNREIRFSHYYYYNLEGEKLEYFEEPCVLMSENSRYKDENTFITKINKKYKKRLESGFVTEIQLLGVKWDPVYYSKFKPDYNTIFLMNNTSIDYELGKKIYYDLINSNLNFVEIFDIIGENIIDMLNLFDEYTYEGVELRDDIIIKLAGKSEKLEYYLVNHNFY